MSESKEFTRSQRRYAKKQAEKLGGTAEDFLNRPKYHRHVVTCRIREEAFAELNLRAKLRNCLPSEVMREILEIELLKGGK